MLRDGMWKGKSDCSIFIGPTPHFIPWRSEYIFVGTHTRGFRGDQHCTYIFHIIQYNTTALSNEIIHVILFNPMWHKWMYGLNMWIVKRQTIVASINCADTLLAWGKKKTSHKNCLGLIAAICWSHNHKTQWHSVLWGHSRYRHRKRTN